MAEDIVENVGFLQIVELVGTANEVACHEPAIGEMVEKDVVGDKAGDRDHPPSGCCQQLFGEFNEIRDARPGQFQHVDAAHEGVGRPAGQERSLAREERVPDGVVVGGIMAPILGDDVITLHAAIISPGPALVEKKERAGGMLPRPLLFRGTEAMAKPSLRRSGAPVGRSDFESGPAVAGPNQNQKSMPPIPPIPPPPMPPPIAGDLSSGSSAIVASVVIRRPATLAAS